MRNDKNLSQGFSLLELLLSIAIISLIILMATRYFSTVSSGQKVSAGVSFVQGVHAAGSSALGSGQTVSATTLCTNKLIPLSYCKGGATTGTALVSPWETSATGASSVSYTAGTGITVTVTGLPGDATLCTNFSNAFPAGDATATCAADNKSISVVFPD